LSRIKTEQKITEDNEIDFAIEAVYENLNLKKEIFKELNHKCGSHVILATNTSAIPITEIAAAAKNPERVIGVHFFSPVLFRPLVEIVRGLLTSEETVRRAEKIVRGLGKETVLVGKDVAGFIVNRINGMAMLEAMRLLEQGVATAEEIDKAIRLGLGHSMGPFETMDFIGLDVVLNASVVSQ
jgi:3-hydroxybutyryl-CoA dehydrogenase